MKCAPLVALVLYFFSCALCATTPSEFVAALQKAASGPRQAEFSANLWRGMPQEQEKIAGLGPAYATARADAKSAYEHYIAGKTPAEVQAAKRVYAAWLTMLDSIGSNGTDPNDVASTPAGVAYLQALNEFKIDTGQ